MILFISEFNIQWLQQSPLWQLPWWEFFPFYGQTTKPRTLSVLSYNAVGPEQPTFKIKTQTAPNHRFYLWVFALLRVKPLHLSDAYFFLGTKITADGACSHEIKRQLLLGRKARTNLDSILKSKNVNLPTNVHIIKATVFPVVMYGCQSWTIKKAECQRIDAFEL